MNLEHDKWGQPNGPGKSCSLRLHCVVHWEINCLACPTQHRRVPILGRLGVCAAPAIAALYTYCHPPGKKAIHIDGKRLKKLAKFVEFPGFVSRTDNKAYMDYLRIPHANRAQSLFPLLFFFRLLIFYSLLQKKFTPNYFWIIHDSELFYFTRGRSLEISEINKLVGGHG